MVFDRGRVGGEATGASAGMIQLNPDRGTPPAYSALATESARLFSALAAELLERTGLDIGYRRGPPRSLPPPPAEGAGEAAPPPRAAVPGTAGWERRACSPTAAD